MYALKVDFENLAEGTPVELDGLGIFENGGAYVIEDDEAEHFRNFHSVQKIKHDKKGKMTVTTELGPTVLEYFEGNPGVEVTVEKGGK